MICFLTVEVYDLCGKYSCSFITLSRIYNYSRVLLSKVGEKVILF